MEFANITDTMRTAKDENKRFVPLFGTDTFRSWILYFRPGEHTDMHYPFVARNLSRARGQSVGQRAQRRRPRFWRKTRSYFSAPKTIIRSPTSALNRWCSWATVPKPSAVPT